MEDRRVHTLRDHNSRWHRHRPDSTEIGWRCDLHTTEVRTELDWQLQHVTLDELLVA